MIRKGIDVSAWQGEIDWNKVKNAGVEFALIRTGYGRSDPNQVDKCFKRNIKGAKEAGILVGSYHYSYAESPEDAVNEAKFCLSILDGESLDLPVYFDIEDHSIASRHDKETRTQMCINFCSEIEKAGYWAGVYANKNWFDNYINYAELKKRYTLWLAHYGIDSPSLDCDIWQYTSKGKIDGINGDVDMDYMYRDLVGDILKSTTSSAKTANQPQDIDTKYYYVNKGDTLWDISCKYLGTGTRYTEIKALNGLSSDTIYPGQTLKIPN